jgi:TPR repeat protein
MGYLFREGKGRPINLKSAADWYKKAAGCGEGSSIYALNHMYLEDGVEAYALLLIAARAIPEAQQDAKG